MKRFLLLLAAAASLSILAIAQNAVPAPSPATTSGTGSASEAASVVPLPAITVPDTVPSPTPSNASGMPLMPEPIPSTSPTAEKRGKGGKTAKGGEESRGGRPGASPGGSPTGTFATELDIRMRLRMRIAETQAINEPDIWALWVAAHKQRSDPALRTALTAFYNTLYDRMIKIDPTIADRANNRRDGSLNRLYYTHLGEEDPYELDPYATPAPAAATEGANPPANDLPPSL
jgi:hypothetical protein